jgi:hypothetical protein
VGFQLCGLLSQEWFTEFFESFTSLRSLDLGDNDWDWELMPVCRSVVELRAYGWRGGSIYRNCSQLFQKLPSITKLVVHDWHACPIAWTSLDPSHLPNLRILECKTSPPTNTPAGLFQNVEKLVISDVKPSSFQAEFLDLLPLFPNLRKFELLNVPDGDWHGHLCNLIDAVSTNMQNLSSLTISSRNEENPPDYDKQQLVDRLLVLPPRVRCVKIMGDKYVYREGIGGRVKIDA